MNKIFCFLFVGILLSACASNRSIEVPRIGNNEDIEEILNAAEESASVGGKKIIETSRAMITNKDIIVGGCWNYIDAVYNRAGFTANERETIFKSNIKGPYVDSNIVKSGDWLYFVNHSYNDIEHSAIFLAWLDEDKKIALMVNYVGERQKKPATYKKFKLDQIYNVMRPKE